MQVHVHIMRQANLIMVHRRVRQDQRHEVQRTVTFHSLEGLDLSQDSILAKFDENIKITHKGKYLKVKIKELS